METVAPFSFTGFLIVRAAGSSHRVESADLAFEIKLLLGA
jgi:hypothetical protein